MTMTQTDWQRFIEDEIVRQQAADAPQAQQPAVQEADLPADHDSDAAQWELLNDAAQRREDFQINALNGSSLIEAFAFGGGTMAQTVAASVVIEANKIGVQVTTPEQADNIIRLAERETLEWMRSKGIHSWADYHDGDSYADALDADAEMMNTPGELFSATHSEAVRQSYLSELAKGLGQDVVDMESDAEDLLAQQGPTRSLGPRDVSYAENARASDEHYRGGSGVDQWGMSEDDHKKALEDFDAELEAFAASQPEGDTIGIDALSPKLDPDMIEAFDRDRARAGRSEYPEEFHQSRAAEQARFSELLKGGE